MLTILFTALHILVCLFLILVILAQQGKGQDLASAFGGGGSQTAFGARGTATLLSKITAGAAITFMVTSLTLSYLRPAVSQNTVVPESAPAVTPEAPPPSGEVPPSEEPGAGESTVPPAETPDAGEKPPSEKPPSESQQPPQ
ncbi:MAG TPA: preprotein translocase subunit SecG [Vicinamibacteria bacterium]|nr:preprotein translocase subunit SecG [Vicinamibacteria bacterium]